jgi:predicted HTH transcriptional regulator
MSQLQDPKNLAQNILETLNKQPHKVNLPVSANRLKILCHAVLEQPQEKPLPPLTGVENNALQAIKADIAQGIQPTVRSVQQRLEYKSQNSARVVIDRLIKHGYIKREGSKKQIVTV